MVRALEEALQMAKSGELLDLGLAMVVKNAGEDPEMVHEFWGRSHFAFLVASVAQLAFALQQPFHGEDD